jgi:CRISPR-associated protein (TIGR02584 family)
MDTSNSVHVMAVLGSSPAVLTELIWHLVEQEGRNIYGVEAWTTTTGMAALRGAVQNASLWDRLLAALGPNADHVPRPRSLEPSHPFALPEISRGAFAVVGLCRDGEWMADIRNADDADAAARLFHERVRTIRTQLPPDVSLIGSLAGGRKTMSAALQGAFELQARPQDRLVHVLVHPAIEADRELRDAFVVPDSSIRIDVPLDEQVEVYDVPFPLVRSMLQGYSEKTAEDIDRFFETGSYDEVLGSISRVARRARQTASVRIDEDPRRNRNPWILTVLDGDEVVDRIRLSQRQAQVYAAIASFGGDGASDLAIYERLAERRLVDTEYVSNTAVKWVSELRKKLQPLRNRGYVDLFPRGEAERRWIEAAANVHGIQNVLMG